MQIDRRPYLRDDRMSDCRSFSSNYYPPSQSRKISIGILVDSIAKKKLGARKEDEAAPNAGNSAEEKNKDEQVTAAFKGKQTKDLEQVNSPWISTRSCQQETPGADNVLHAKESSIPVSRGRKNKLGGLKVAPVAHSVQFFGNQTSILQSVDNSLKKFSGITYKRKAGEDKMSEREEDFSFPAAQENPVSDKPVVADKTETLKMKLWEILGNVTSPKSQPTNSQARDIRADKLEAEQIVDQKRQTDVRSRQNSDTIETDSESPDNKLKRPLTHSSTRKKVLTKGRSNKSKAGPSSAHKQKHQEKDNFSFKEEWGLSKVDGAHNRGSTLPARKRSQRKSSTIEPRKICFNEKESSDEIQQTTNRSETPPPADKASSQGKRMGDTYGHPSEEKNGYFDIKSKIQEGGTHQSPVSKIYQHGEFCSPMLPENQEQQDISHPSSENMMDKRDDIRSPTFRINTPIPTPQPSPMPKSDQMEHGVRCPSTERRYTMQNIHSFKSLQASKSDGSRLLAQHEISDEEEELKDSPPKNKRKDSEERRYTVENIRSLKSLQTSKSDSSSLHAQTETSDEEEELKDPPPRKPAPNNERKDAEERGYTMENICSFKRLQTSKSDSSRLLAQSETSDEEEELKDSPSRKPAPINERKNAEEGLPESSSEEVDTESSEEGSPVIKGRREKETSFEIAITGRSKFKLRPTKRLRLLEDTGINEFSTPLPSPKGLGETDWIHEPSEQNQEDDDLTRVVKLFALALENFKSKMTLATQKKSSEILISASEGMHMQLQNLQSQIQTDKEKLASLSKSKRKRLESAFQEQQKQLKLMHEKFKEDLQQHLQDCRGTLEGLEGHQIELTETIKKQKASHQKLLSQMEESVESQLGDAQRRIRAVHQLAREKMLQLKHVIAECLKEGI